MATQEELLNQASEICDAEHEGENTAVRVGTMLINIIEYLGQFMTNTQLETALREVSAGLNAWLEDYARIDSDSGLLDYTHSWFVPLSTMGTAFDESPEEYTPTPGELFYRDQSGYQIHTKTASGAIGTPAKTGVVYFNKRTGKSYRWNGSSMVELGTAAVHPQIIDYFTAPLFSDIAVGQSYLYTAGHVRRLAVKTGSDSSYSFDPDPKVIYCFRDTRTTMIWDNSTSTWQQVGGGDVEVINSLGSTETRKPLSAKMGHDLLVLIQQIYNSLGNAAFWGAKPEIDWSSAGLTTHNITRSLGGHASSSSSATSVAEGARLTETITFDAGWIKSSLTVEMNNVPVPQYISGNTIDIPSVTGPVVITATAVQGTAVALTLNGGLHCADSNGNTIPNPTAATSGEPLSFEVWPDKWWQVPVLAAANDAKMTGGSLLLESITRQVTGQSTWDASGVETQNQTVTAYGLRVTAKNGSSNEVTGAITLKLTAKDVIQVGEFFAGSSSGNDGSLQYNNTALCRTACYIPLINANTVWWRWGSSAGANRFASAFYPATGHDTQGNNGWCNDQGSEKYYPTSGDMSERPYARCTFVVDEIAYGYFEQITSGSTRQRLFTPAPYYYAKLANS